MTLKSNGRPLHASVQHRETRENKKLFLAHAEAHPDYTIKSLIETFKRVNGTVGMHENTLNRWRRRDPGFKAELELIRGKTARPNKTNPDFANFRRDYFGMETTWFQQVAVKALEDTRPGEIVLLLWPP